MSTPREHRILCLSALSLLCLSNIATSAGAAEDIVCPNVKTGQIIYFDNTTIIFDSVPSNISEDATQITYFVKFAKISHEYLVDWSGINLKDVFTNNGYLSTSSAVRSHMLAPTAPISRSEFSKSLKDAVEKLTLRALNWVSSFRASVSTAASGQPEPARQEKLQPVDLEFTSEHPRAER